MNFKDFDLLKADINPFDAIGKQWFLITAGNAESYNTMTASWGSMGVMWNKNIVTVVIRPQRYTKQFVDSNETFTVSFFEEKDKDILKFCGTNSGKDVNKSEKTGLVPVEIDDTVTFEQARTVFVCKKLYVQQITSEGFLDKSLLSNYPNSDFHYAITAEIVKAVRKN